MSAHRRIALGIAAALAASVGLASATLGAQAQFIGAGNYDFAHTNAFFQTSPSDFTQPSIFISVNVEHDISMPLGAPRTTTDNVQLFYDFSSESGFGEGCVFLNPSDFTVSSDLQTATLSTTIAQDTPTCGFPPFGTLPTIDVTWTASTPVLSFSGTGRFACVGYTNESRSSNSSDGANATATLAPALSGSFAATRASILSSDQLIHAQGAVPPDTCAQGFGKGAFGGFLAAGTYSQNVVQANANLFPNDPSMPLIFVTVRRIAGTSRPLSGVATSTNETDLDVFVQSSTLSGSGCFVIDPTNFTVSSDLTSAALHSKLTGQTPTCQSNNSLSPPLNVDVTSSGPGPISTISGDSQIACQRYHSVTSSRQTINGSGTATIALDAFTSSFTTTAAIGTSDSRTTATGVLAPTCTLN